MLFSQQWRTSQEFGKQNFHTTKRIAHVWNYQVRHGICGQTTLKVLMNSYTQKTVIERSSGCRCTYTAWAGEAHSGTLTHFFDDILHPKTISVTLSKQKYKKNYIFRPKPQF